MTRESHSSASSARDSGLANEREEAPAELSSERWERISSDAASREGEGVRSVAERPRRLRKPKPEPKPKPVAAAEAAFASAKSSSFAFASPFAS